MTSLRKTALLAVLLDVVVSGFSPAVEVSGFSRTGVVSGFSRTGVVSGFSRTLMSMAAQEAPPPTTIVEPGTLPKAWMTGGPNCLELPAWQVHEYNPNFFILRESGCIHDEKPFLYLLILSPRAPRP